MTWMRSLSTSSWILLRACAGEPALSPTNSSILRPGQRVVALVQVLHQGALHVEAAGRERAGLHRHEPEPDRAALRAHDGGSAERRSAEAVAVALMNRLRVMAMSSLLWMVDPVLASACQPVVT